MCRALTFSVNNKTQYSRPVLAQHFSKNTNDQMEEGLCLMPDSPYSIQLCAAPDSDKACRLLDFLYGTDREFFFCGHRSWSTSGRLRNGSSQEPFSTGSDTVYPPLKQVCRAVRRAVSCGCYMHSIVAGPMRMHHNRHACHTGRFS